MQCIQIISWLRSTTFELKSFGIFHILPMTYVVILPLLDIRVVKNFRICYTVRGVRGSTHLPLRYWIFTDINFNLKNPYFHSSSCPIFLKINLTLAFNYSRISLYNFPYDVLFYNATIMKAGSNLEHNRHHYFEVYQTLRLKLFHVLCQIL